jgi:hypothetical protein
MGKKKAMVKCNACGSEYEIGMPHSAFCPAMTCDICGNSVGHAIKPQDRGKDGLVRVCDECVMDGL